MGSEFGDPAVLHDRHPVGGRRGVQPVRDGDHGPARQDAVQRTLQVAGRGRVQQRSRLVEHHGVGIGEYHPRQGELLRGGRGHGHRAPAEPRVEAVRQ